MANPVPSQPAPPAPQPPTAAPQAPGIVQAFVGVLTRPAEFYASVRDAAGLGAPIVFALVMGVLSGVITAVYTTLGLGAVGGVAGGAIGMAAGVGAIIMTPIFAVIGCFVGGAIVHVISMIAGGKGSYEQSARVAAYAGAVMPISSLLAFTPLLRMLPGLYGLYLVAVGLITIHAADRKRTYTVVGILAALLVLFSIMAMLAARAVRDMGSEMQTKFGPNSQFQRDLQKAQDEMKRAAEEMKRQAEAAEQQAKQLQQQQQQQAPPPAEQKP